MAPLPTPGRLDIASIWPAATVRLPSSPPVRPRRHTVAAFAVESARRSAPASAVLRSDTWGIVFENGSEPSRADATHAGERQVLLTSTAPDQVFESTPAASSADAGHNTVPRSFDSRPPQYVFESRPQPSTADTSEQRSAVAAPCTLLHERFREVPSLSDGDVCPICQDDDQRDVVELHCGGHHRFHRVCIVQWFHFKQKCGYQKGCPICARKSQTKNRIEALDGQWTFTNTPEIIEVSASSSSLPPEARGGVFENNPAPSAAYASGRDERREQVAEHLIVYESSPVASTADASGVDCPWRSAVGLARLSGVFENMPRRSVADASYRPESIASKRRASSQTAALSDDEASSASSASSASPTSSHA